MSEAESFDVFRSEYGYWGWDDNRPNRVETDYYWAEDFSAMWDDGGCYTGKEADTDEFLDWYDETRLVDSRDNAEEGPTIETVVVHVFDVEKDRLHANYRECMGFYMVWEKGFGAARGLWGKSLTFYACGNDGHLMSEDKLTRILASFSIEGEFEALVD